MNTNLPKRLFRTICGAIIGAVIISYAYSVQGGHGRSFTLVGGAVGAFAGFNTASSQLRLRYLTSAIGSIVSLMLFQVPVCDGSHIGLPALGAAIGALIGVYLESACSWKSPRFGQADPDV